MHPLIKATDISFSIKGETILHEHSFAINKGECIIITGASGSGKTTLGKIIAGHYPVSSGSFTVADDLRKVFVHQQHDFRFAFQSRSYFGQRFDRNYAGQFPTVYSILSKGVDEHALKEVSGLLSLDEKLDQPVIELSNGEGKRVQLAQALLLKPDLMVLDQPFIGLDVKTRELLRQLLVKLKNDGITVAVISSPDEIPDCADRLFVMEDGRFTELQTPEELVKDFAFNSDERKEIEWKEIERLSPVIDETFEIAIQMTDVNISFEDKVILEDVSWTVKKGEHWALIGHNGSGKSTLLSLINADNPQVYLNDIQLFDQKRGSGESIWDIKKKIGYVSPEMHVFFQRTGSYVETISLSANDYTLDGFSQEQTTCYEAICSGFNDQMGSSATISFNQHSLVTHWMEALEIKHLQHKPFYKASLGEQRVLLLVRALVKNPPLLLLDEPCQGLDKFQTQRFTSIVDDICCHFNKTLIYVSHYANEMPTCINHQIVLEKGRIKELF